MNYHQGDPEVSQVLFRMGRSHLVKLIRQRAKDDALVVKRSATGGGKDNAKRCKTLPHVPAKPHEDALVDLDHELAGHASAYASLVGTLSNSSMAMRLRKMQQEGDSEEEEQSMDGDEGQV